jgi:hypothetical protein
MKSVTKKVSGPLGFLVAGAMAIAASIASPAAVYAGGCQVCTPTAECVPSCGGTQYCYTESNTETYEECTTSGGGEIDISGGISGKKRGISGGIKGGGGKTCKEGSRTKVSCHYNGKCNPAPEVEPTQPQICGG